MCAALVGALVAMLLPQSVVTVRTAAPAYRATAYASAPVDEGAFSVRLTLPEGVERATLVGRLLRASGEPEAERVAEGLPSGEYRIAFYLENWAPGEYTFEVGAWDGGTLLGEGSSRLTIAQTGEREVVLDAVGCLRLSGQALLPIGWEGPAPDDGLQRLPTLGFNLWLPPADALADAADEARGRVFVALPVSSQSAETLANPAVLLWTLPSDDPAAYAAAASADPWRPVATAAAAVGSGDIAIVAMPPGDPLATAAAVLETEESTGGGQALWLRIAPDAAEDLRVLAARVRAGLAYGCRGVIVAPSGGSAAEWAERLRPILSEVAGLAPFWLAPGCGFAVGCEVDGVLACARRVGRDDAVLLVNARDADVEALLEGLPGTDLVDAEGREVAIGADGSARVSVPALGFRMFRLRG